MYPVSRWMADAINALGVEFSEHLVVLNPEMLIWLLERAEVRNGSRLGN